MALKETVGEIAEVLGMVAFLNRAVTAIAALGAQAEDDTPPVQLDETQALGLSGILGTIEAKLTVAFDSLLELIPDEG